MDPELQALREARLAQLKADNNGSLSNNGGKIPNRAQSSPQPDSPSSIGAALAPFLEPQALERLSRVNMVRPERAHGVESYLTRLIQSGHVTRKITEDEIVQILNGVARQENKDNETRIIFNRRDDEDWEADLAAEQSGSKESDDDDFFE